MPPIHSPLYSRGSAAIWIVIAVLAAAVIALFVLVLRPPQSLQVPSIQTEKLTVVESDGTRRVVIANEANFPLPYLGGEEFPRSIDPAGFVFYDRDGNETGGIGILKTDKIRASRMIFDYQNTDGIGWGTWETPDGGFGAGFSIADRNDISKSIRELGTSEGVTRATLENENRTVALTLFDTEGRARIRLSVDERDQAAIEMIDAEGLVTARIPEIQTE